MPPSSASFTALNLPEDAVPDFMGSFALAALPNTDLWRKPPSRDTSTAPILYTALRNPFISAEVTVSADWELEWDQGGLVIFAGAPPGHLPRPPTAPDPPTASIVLDAPTTRPRSPPPPYSVPAPAAKWVKVGLEFCNAACHATSVVANSDGADWALTSLPPYHARRADLRVKIERIGYALWVWYEDSLLGWKKLREVTWFFWGVEDKAVRVGVYASRPANFGVSLYEARGRGRGTRCLRVGFEGLEIF
jgi:regulation of enolase protein 1 (concanavalin A-like superfamily)